MQEATYVAFVPKPMRAKLRDILKSEDLGPMRWREERRLRGSEFYFTGPANLARKTHAYVINWVCGVTVLQG
jgi:hypothetical protein